MAENPLEGLMSVSQQLVQSSTTESLRLQLCPPPCRGGRQFRNWACECQPGSDPGSVPVVPSKTIRSQNSPENAARERSRVRNLRQAFLSLQAALPSVPADTKLSKLDVLLLAADYIAHLTHTLQQEGVLAEDTITSRPGGNLHPVKKWPMRTLLYCGNVGQLLTTSQRSSVEKDGL
ncbi:transcription factor 24-like [Takifugu flavidus]|uniref:Transcription factor 23 n=1 Tax=Takifugu flavidus TaxID=433684 RepID=A0A5C6NMS6_9TELE|nr:transcription factor 24-like [Takifugu flavidus]TWW68366.1 Transcription factor 23 [Takifugu flavidus]|eukprot:XP_011616937.1 PREDICTED: transcription factor 24-like [Takifugu rubripes]